MWYYEVTLVRFKNSSGLVTNNGIIDLWQVRTRRDLWNNKHYTREVTIAYLKLTKSIVLFDTIPILTEDSKRRRNGGAAPSLLTISSQACQAVCKN